MMNLRPYKLLTAFVLLTAIAGCEGYSTAEGVIKDKITGLPLDSVLCKVTTGIMEVYTDTSGKYDVHNRKGSCVGGCKDITVEFSKKNYKTITKSEHEASGFIYMEK